MTALSLEERFAHLIEATSGNVVPPAHYPFLAHLAQQRAQATGFASPHAYLLALERGTLPLEWQELLPRLTVKESYLFRTPQHFQVIARALVPELVRARAGVRRLSALSAGCARGEEPASLAMVLADHPMLVGWEWRITAADIDSEALAQARRGLFSHRAVQQVPEDLRRRFLSPRSGGWQLASSLLERIVFQPLNLVQEPLLVGGAPFDLILLRNVLIYFRPDCQRRVAQAIAAVLAADGALFLGPTETLWQATSLLVPVDADGCFYYRHAAAANPGEPPPSPLRRGARRDRWEEKIAPAQASAKLRAPLVEPLTNPERLLRATEAATANRLDEATALVEEALLADPGDPAAHALEGFLRDLQNHSQLAVASYRAALFLEPELAQVRLLLALCLRRLGWEARCRQELRQALASLARGGGRAVAELTSLGVPNGEALHLRVTQVLGSNASSIE